MVNYKDSSPAQQESIGKSTGVWVGEVGGRCLTSYKTSLTPVLFFFKVILELPTSLS